MVDGPEFSISSIRSVLLSAVYPSGAELAWVGGVIRSWDAALVEVTLNDGSVGLGEVGAAIMAPAAVPGIVDALRIYIDGLTLDHPLQIGDYLRDRTAFWARGGIAAGTIGAVETACLDAVSKRSGLPAHEFLGGRSDRRIEAYASGGLGSTFAEVADWALKQTSQFRTVKFRAMRDPDTTIELVRHVAARLPADTRFVLDAVQGCASEPWSTEDAIRVGAVCAELGARWYEEPCRAENIGGYTAVSHALPVAVSGVESYATLQEFAALIDAGGVAIAQPDVSFVGGPMSFRRIVDLAAAHKVDCVPHVWGSGVTMLANLHVSASHPHVRLFEYCTLDNPLRDALMVEPPRVHAGQLHLPTTPGLGVRLTDEIERRFPFQPGMGHQIRTQAEMVQ